MKLLQKVTVVLVSAIAFAACQSSMASNNGLLNPNTRKEIMDTIANDTSMCKEMMGAMMNNKNGKMIMMEHGKMMMMEHGKMMMMEDHDGLSKMMGNHSEMMKNMIEDCKKDTALMMAMCKKMMDEPKIMDMMQKMKGGKMTMDKMDSKDKMQGMDHKMH